MKRTSLTWISACLLILPTVALGFAAAQTTKAPKTDAEIRQEIIKQSIASYKGSCPCPYNMDRAGRMCGRRSAYSKPGGLSPYFLTEKRAAISGAPNNQKGGSVVVRRGKEFV